MNEEIKNKLSKIYELVNRGATEGERIAAKKALDRIIDRHKITAADLDNISLKTYSFKYTTSLELLLLQQIIAVMIDGINRTRRKPWIKTIVSDLNYEEWVTVECAYEYFRKHMKKEWNRLCMPEIKKARTTKTRNQRRKYLQSLFISQYILKSNLYLPKQKTVVEVKSKKEALDRAKMSSVEGGKYNRQIITNNLLN